jgi:pre-rRNA-processing protein TSR1
MPSAIWHCLLFRPIFSTDDLNSDKHKMERYTKCVTGACSLLKCIRNVVTMVGLRNLLAHMVWFFCLSSLNFEGIGFHFHPKQDSSIKFSYVAGILCSIRWYKWCGIFWFFAGNFCDLCSGAMKYTFNGILQQHDTVRMSLYKTCISQNTGSQFLILDHAVAVSPSYKQ